MACKNAEWRELFRLSRMPRATLTAQAVSGSPPTALTREVFVVHDHDVEAKEGVARFVEKLGLVPIILHTS